MMRGVAHLCAIPAALGILLTVPAHAEEKFDPFSVDEARVRRDVHTIALAPLTVPVATADVPSVRAHFDSIVTSQLEAGGFAVVPSTQYERVWHMMSVRLGGVYDTLTGVPDSEKLGACREHTVRELQREHGADAVLVTWIAYDTARPGVLPKEATIGSRSRPYVVFGEPLTWEGRPLEALLRNLPQRVVAAYYNAALYDASGEEMYSARSGVRWTRIYFGATYRDRREAPWFGAEAHNREAVQVALGPLTRRVPTDGERSKW